MAKKRIIDSRIRRSQDFAKLSWRQRDLWHGIITVADDQGRLLGIPASVRSEVWPMDDVTLAEVGEDLGALEDLEMIHIYQVENRPVIQIVNWWRYQKRQWAGPSDYLAPDGWVDRLRYHGAEHKIVIQGWDQPGGWLHEPGKKPGKKPGNNQVEDQVKVNDLDLDLNSDKEVKRAPANLDGWHQLLKTEKNYPATLRFMVETLYPHLVDFPEFSYLGKIANKVGGAGRLASLLWEFAPKKPDGDILAYIQAATKGRKKEPAGFDGLREFAQDQGWPNEES